MKLIPVNGVNVCELVFVPEMDVFSACFNFWNIFGRWTYKHCCHLLAVVNSFVA